MKTKKTKKSTAKLDLVYLNSYEFAVAWYDEDGEGAYVGQDAGEGEDAHRAGMERALKAKELDAYEYRGIELAAILDGAGERGRYGFTFESENQAKKFLVRMRAELKKLRLQFANAEHPWPEWAITAKTEGWTPPKGWKP